MSNITEFTVRIKGNRPLLQHRFGPDSISLEKKEKSGVAGNDPEEWKQTRMVTAEGQLYVLPSYIFGMLKEAAKHTKQGKGSLEPKVAACLQVKDNLVLLDRYMPADKDLTNDLTEPVYIDVQGVKNPTTKARNIRYRLAASPGWKSEFTIVFDKTLVSRDQMKAVINDAGKLVGLADGRKVGCGRFDVIDIVEGESA